MSNKEAKEASRGNPFTMLAAELLESLVARLNPQDVNALAETSLRTRSALESVINDNLPLPTNVHPMHLAIAQGRMDWLREFIQKGPSQSISTEHWINIFQHTGGKERPELPEEYLQAHRQIGIETDGLTTMLKAAQDLRLYRTMRAILDTDGPVHFGLSRCPMVPFLMTVAQHWVVENLQEHFCLKESQQLELRAYATGKQGGDPRDVVKSDDSVVAALYAAGRRNEAIQVARYSDKAKSRAMKILAAHSDNDRISPLLMNAELPPNKAVDQDALENAMHEAVLLGNGALCQLIKRYAPEIFRGKSFSCDLALASSSDELFRVVKPADPNCAIICAVEADLRGEVRYLCNSLRTNTATIAEVAARSIKKRRCRTLLPELLKKVKVHYDSGVLPNESSHFGRTGTKEVPLRFAWPRDSRGWGARMRKAVSVAVDWDDADALREILRVKVFRDSVLQTAVEEGMGRGNRRCARVVLEEIPSEVLANTGQALKKVGSGAARNGLLSKAESILNDFFALEGLAAKELAQLVLEGACMHANSEAPVALEGIRSVARNLFGVAKTSIKPHSLVRLLEERQMYHARSVFWGHHEVIEVDLLNAPCRQVATLIQASMRFCERDMAREAFRAFVAGERKGGTFLLVLLCRELSASTLEPLLGDMIREELFMACLGMKEMLTPEVSDHLLRLKEHHGLDVVANALRDGNMWTDALTALISGMEPRNLDYLCGDKLTEHHFAQALRSQCRAMLPSDNVKRAVEYFVTHRNFNACAIIRTL